MIKNLFYRRWKLDFSMILSENFPTIGEFNIGIIAQMMIIMNGSVINDTSMEYCSLR